MSVITKVLGAIFSCAFLLPAAAHAIVVTPTAIDFELQQQEQGSVEVIIANNGTTDAEYELDILAVKLDETRGSMEVSALTTAEQKWFTLSGEAISLAPEEAQIIVLHVNPPDSMSAGIYTFGLEVKEIVESSGGIAPSSGVLSLVFVTIGSPDAKAELLDFSVDQERFSELPVTFAVTVRNGGERIVQPVGSIQIYNAFGTIVRQLPLNVDGKRIFAGEERTLMVQWGGDEDPQSLVQKLYVQASQFVFGPFSAEIIFTPWEGADPLAQQVALFAFPWQLFLLLTILIIVIVVFARIKR